MYTSSLGTHTFFMIMLPMLYFFGAPEFGRGYVRLYRDCFLECVPVSIRPKPTLQSCALAIPVQGIYLEDVVMMSP